MYSFKQWCLDNDHKSWLDLWDYKLNRCNPDEVSHSTKKKYWFKCNIHGSYQKSIWNLINSKDLICPICDSFYYWCIKNNREDLIDAWNEEVNGDIKKYTKASGKKCYFTLNKELTRGVEVSLCSITGCKNIDPIKKYKDSLGFYMIETYSEEYLFLVWSILNKKDAFSFARTSKTQNIYLNCLEVPHHEAYKTSPAMVSQGCKCPYCASKRIHPKDSFGQMLLDEYGSLDVIWDFEKNDDLDPFKLGKQSNKKVWLFCLETNHHGSYEISCANYYNGCRCSYCKKWSNKVHPMDSLGYCYPEISKIWSDKNIKQPEDYRPKSHERVWLKCENHKHDDYLRIISDYTQNGSVCCPECVRERDCSSYQEKVFNYIYSLGYTVNKEYNCNILPINPKTKRPLPFDNEIVELNLIVEVHGKQHYDEKNGLHILGAKQSGRTVKEQFEYSVWKDEYKKEFALKNGYYYIALDYRDIQSDKYIEILNNKIKTIILNKETVETTG